MILASCMKLGCAWRLGDLRMVAHDDGGFVWKLARGGMRAYMHARMERSRILTGRADLVDRV